MLQGQGLAQVVLFDRTTLQKKSPEPAPCKVLNAQGSGEVVFRNEVRPDQQLTESSHAQLSRRYRQLRAGSPELPRMRQAREALERLWTLLAPRRSAPDRNLLSVLHCGG